MRSFILLLIMCCTLQAAYSQVTPFTGGTGSGFTGKVSASISCPLFFGGEAGGAVVNKTPAIVCAMFFGGSGDGADVAQSHCEELLTEAAASRVAEGTRNVAANVKTSNNAAAILTKDEVVVAGSMKVYPNPATGVATLRIEQVTPVRTQIIVYRADGQVVWSFHVQLTKGINTVPIDVSRLAGGLYVIYHSAQRERAKVLVMAAH